jgi:hypothetical protein
MSSLADCDLTGWAKSLPVEAIPGAFAQLAAAQSTLVARFIGNISGAAGRTARQPDIRQAEPEPLVDAKEMARRLGVCESWVRTEQRAGRIPFIPVGRYVRFRPSEVLCALQERS